MKEIIYRNIACRTNVVGLLAQKITESLFRQRVAEMTILVLKVAVHFLKADARG